jgi:hypothetical protein
MMPVGAITDVEIGQLPCGVRLTELGRGFDVAQPGHWLIRRVIVTSKEVGKMGSEHTVADDIVYDLISIQYHALKAAEVYDKFLEDAHSSEHQDVAAFIRQCKDEDQQRAIRCHEFLGQLTRSGIG